MSDNQSVKRLSDASVIGKPLTVMFRLEAEAPQQGIIMPRWYFDNNVRESRSWVKSGEYAAWIHSEAQTTLRGVGELMVTKLTYNPR